MVTNKEIIQTICCVRCPFCGKSVTAVVKEARIHCPECQSSAPYTKEIDHTQQESS